MSVFAIPRAITVDQETGRWKSIDGYGYDYIDLDLHRLLITAGPVETYADYQRQFDKEAVDVH